MLTMSYNAATKSLVCAFSGHMDSANCDEAAQQLTAKIAELAPAGGGKVHAVAPGLKIAFDLQAVEYVSSVFLRVVLATAKRVEKGAFAITKCQTAVRDLLKTAGMEQWLAQDEGIESLMRETRVFPPPAEFAAAARVKSLEEYRALHAASVADPETFWAGRARELVQWMRPFDKTLEWTPPNAKWFLGGQLNVSANCLDKHLATDVADKPAIVWEGERALEGLPGESRTLTYRQLHREVCRFANVLRSLGAGKGSRVLIYLPMVPEAAVAMLACARVGAIHSVVFGGFSSSAVAERAKDCGAKIIVTADGGFRRGAVTPLKRNVDDALGLKDENGKLYCAAVEKVVVLRRTGCPVDMRPGRDVWWHDEMVQALEDCPAEVMDSEDTLFILYTSGSTGKPKGIYHSSAGYLLGAALSFQMVFDIKPSDVYWCTADVGWITGHTYVVYGPLASGATVLIYEGAPNYPDNSRFWNIVERHKVTIFYTAPTAIRSFMQWGNQWIEKHDLSSLRLLGTVGEPINPQAWIWYHDTIGRGRLPIVDTWWQTETGSIMIAPLPGATPLKPGSATLPFFGIQAEVVDDKGEAVAPGMGERLVIRKPWPSMLRGVWGDPQRFE